MAFFNNEKCKKCQEEIEEIENEGLLCSTCSQYVHVNCLDDKGTPGSLHGDIFFNFTCKECSKTSNEMITRDKISWLQVITLVLYHLNKKCSGLARRGFFHWKLHLASFIDKNWDIIFKKEIKRTKKWTGTIPGMLSTYSQLFFTSGTSIFNEQGWWTLTYPNLSPYVISKLYADFLIARQAAKEKGDVLTDTDLMQRIIEKKNFKQEHLISVRGKLFEDFSSNNLDNSIKKEKHYRIVKQKKHMLPSIENICDKPSKKICKEKEANSFISDASGSCCATAQNDEIIERKMIVGNDQKLKYLDPFCHYNTSLNLKSTNGITIKEKLLGKIREEPILSPYSNIYLKPYIRRDYSTSPNWLKLMAELLVKVNQNKDSWTLPPRYPLDYTYIQPEHIPAINSLCNQFFWPGIDLTECLQYPDFSCVVLYRKLIVGFAFLVPDVSFHENYLSFIFTRPGWRNVGIGKFMIYHLIQMSMGKDITLHVSINNPALFLYQKFGFKVENVVLDFYEKYVRRNTGESKNAFFCRLER